MAAAVAVRVAVSPGTGEELLAMGAACGVALIVAAVASGMSILSHWGVGVVAGFYAVSCVVAGGPPDPCSPAVAIGLVLAAELASWSIDCRRRGHDDLAVHVIRLRTMAVISAPALVLVLLTENAATFGGGGDVVAGLAVAALLGCVAAVCALILGLRRSA